MQVHGREADLAGATEDEEVVEQRGDAVDLAHDQVGGGAVAFARGAFLQQLGGAADPAEWIANFVGDARGDLAERRDARALALDFAQRRAERQVAQPDDGAARLARLVRERRDGGVHQQVALEAPRHAHLVLDAGSAGREHRAHRLGEAARADHLLDRSSRDRFGRRLENPARLGVQAHQAAVAVDDGHSVDERIENAREIVGHAEQDGPRCPSFGQASHRASRRRGGRRPGQREAA